MRICTQRKSIPLCFSTFHPSSLIFRFVYREIVRLALKVIDPDGIEIMREKRRKYLCPVTIATFPYKSRSLSCLIFLFSFLDIIGLLIISSILILFQRPNCLWHIDGYDELKPPGGYSQKNLVGVCGPLPKTLTLFMTKICDFPYPIYDLTKDLIPYL